VLRSAVAVGAVVVLASDLFILTQRTRTTTVARSDALRAVRAHPRAPTIVSTPVASDPQAASSPGGTTSTTTPRQNASRSATSLMLPGAAPERAPPLRPFHAPPAGVYAYETRGGEQISLAAAHHDYPPETYATVRPTSGCGWLFEHRIVKEHTDRLTLCSNPTGLLQLAQEREIEFFGQTDGDTYRCDVPPSLLYAVSDTSGRTHHLVCRSSDGTATASLSTSYAGRERRTIGADAVDAVHFRLTMTVAGGRIDHGTGRYDYWVHPDTGMLLHVVRDLDITAHATFGNVRYREQADLKLKSLVPAT
jgi:hypothetical protein